MIYTLKQNGMELIDTSGDDLLVVCKETDELVVLKPSPTKKPKFGIKHKGVVYLCDANFSASYVLQVLQEEL